MTRFGLLFLGLAVSALPLAAQSDAPRFEVASVKPLPAGSNIAGYRPEPTRFSGYFSVVDAVAYGYQIEPNRIVNAPQWAKDQRYEINARTRERKPGELLPMMRNLLAERFALKVHRERRPMPVLDLTLARSDGSLGPKLQRVQRDCAQSAASLNGCSHSFGVVGALRMWSGTGSAICRRASSAASLYATYMALLFGAVAR